MTHQSPYTPQLHAKTGIETTQNLPFESLQKLFLTAVSDFKEGKTKLEDLSVIAADLVQMPLDDDTPEMAELKEAVYLCSEIGFYLRQIPEVDKDGAITLDFVVRTMKYHYKHSSDL